MRTFLIEPSRSQRRILAMLIEEESGIPPVNLDAPAQAADFSADDRVFLDVSFDPNDCAPATVIATGSSRQDAALAERIGQGAAAFLLKPFSKSSLRQALAESALLASKGTAR